jgi:hypothetical protein
MKKQKQCPQIPANGFMSARVVVCCSSQRKGIVVFSVLTVLFHAHPFNKAPVLVVPRRKNIGHQV